MTNKQEDNDLWTYGILGAVGSAVIGLLLQALAQKPPNFSNNLNNNVNSYQSQSSYSQPTPSSKSGGSGCGCNGARR